MFCCKCGAEININDNFCSNCGAEVNSNEINICGNCGAEIDLNDNFCSICGEKINRNVNDEIFNSIHEKEKNIESGLFGLARNFFNKKENDNTSPLFSLARTNFFNKEYEKADYYFNEIKSIDKKLLNDEDFYMWGLSLSEIGEFQKAKDMIRQANVLSPSERYSKALKDITDQEIKNKKDDLYNYLSNNEFNKVNDCFINLQYFSDTKLTHEDYYFWGICLEKLGKEADAYEKFKKANSKKQLDKYINKINSIEQKQIYKFNEFIKNAYCSFENKKYIESNKYFSNASKLMSKNFTDEDYFTWGLCLMNLQKSNQAKDKFDEANKIKPCSKYSNAYANELLNTSNISPLLKEANKAFNEKDYGKALKYVDRVIELDNKNIEALLLYGEIHLKQNNQRAGHYFEKVLEIDPNNKKAKRMLAISEGNDNYWLDIGVKKLKLGDYIDAIYALEICVEINPHNAEAWSKLCVSHQNQKNYPQALEAINKSLKIDSKNDQYWFNKGQVLFWMGEFRTSIQCFNQAIRLNPEECSDAYAIRGMAFIRLDKMMDGMGSLIKSLRNNPKNKLALEAIKHTKALDIQLQKEDYISSSKFNLSPEVCARMRVMPEYVNSLNEDGINIGFEFNPFGLSRLMHDSKEYLFNKNELDGAFAYVIDIWYGEYMAEELGDFGGLKL